MISVGEAKAILTNTCKALPPKKVFLQEAHALVLAENIYASINMPSFNQSAMDGYAFCFDDWQGKEILSINGVVPAGANPQIVAEVKQAIRIFTGAAVPQGFDTVVMQEKVEVLDHQLTIKDSSLIKGSNVRLIGNDIKTDDLALEKDTTLTPAAIGFLAGLGIKEVTVYPEPKIKLIITGNELVQPGKKLAFGQVYESNSFTIKAALQQMGLTDISIEFVKDDANELKQVFGNALQSCDLLLITGGVSVGDYDFVVNCLENCGVEKLFHKLKQKPGKPLFAGVKDYKIVFGLPGNPSSVLTCFYEYVLPCINQLMNKKIDNKIKSFYLANEFSKKAGLTHFLKGNYADNKVTILTAQESYRLSSFATANCLVCLAEEGTDYHVGDLVEVHIFSEDVVIPDPLHYL